MSRNKRRSCLVILLAVICLFFKISRIEAASYKILVVMSYEEENPWCKQIKKGIDSVLAGNSNIKYFYMDTKKNFRGGDRKAKEAHQLYRQFGPDGVIAVDDNAQSMFVVPYLKDKVKIPVMFSAVNDEPEKYGYPASNVSGILERNFIAQSIAFAKQLISSIQTVGFLARDSPSGRAILKEVEKKSDAYLAKSVGFSLVKTIKETHRALDEFMKAADVLFVDATNGILDAEGRPLNNKQVTQIIARSFKKPMIGTNDFHVRNGVLCAVVKSGNAHGRVSAEMLLKAIKGTPVKNLPITVNKYGKRMLNVDVMKELGIRPKRRVLVGTEIVRF